MVDVQEHPKARATICHGLCRDNKAAWEWALLLLLLLLLLRINVVVAQELLLI